MFLIFFYTDPSNVVKLHRRISNDNPGIRFHSGIKLGTLNKNTAKAESRIALLESLNETTCYARQS